MAASADFTTLLFEWLGKLGGEGTPLVNSIVAAARTGNAIADIAIEGAGPAMRGAKSAHPASDGFDVSPPGVGLDMAPRPPIDIETLPTDSGLETARVNNP